MAASGKLGHHALGLHAGGDHVAVVAVAGDHLIAGLERHLHADDHRFLADIEVAEAADQPHAVHLPGLLLEAADGQHGAEGGEFLLLAEFGDRRCGRRPVLLGAWGFFGDGHEGPCTRASDRVLDPIA